MIVGVGVDVVDVARFERAIARTPGIAARLFTADERGVLGGGGRPAASLAARFAAKEAVAKALGAPSGLRWVDVEVRTDRSGRPCLQARGTVAEEARRRGARRWHVSLSHDAGVVVAMVVAES